MNDLLPIDLSEQIAEVDREVKMRLQVYGRNVARGTMKQADADRRIAVMKAVATTLRKCRESGSFY